MRAATRAAWVLAACGWLAVQSGCTKRCGANTLFLTLQLEGASKAADTVLVDVAIGQGAVLHGDGTRSPGGSTSTVVIEFPAGDYPAGKQVTVTVAALVGPTQVGKGMEPATTLADGCQALTIMVQSASAADAGVADMESSDGGSPDGGGCTATSCGDGQTCVDGVCCSSPCTGQCEACNVPGSVGTCVAVTGAPVGNRSACAAAGTTCGGTCDGTNHTGCTYPGSETNCVQPSCTNGLKVVTAACDGTGNCPAGQTVQCTPPTCNAGGTDCASTCANDGDCSGVSGKPYCDSGACTVHKPIGESCGVDGDCNLGHCVDGVCCNQACSGQCQACDVAGAVGTCTPVVSGPPHNVSASGRAACSGVGTCAGSCATGQTQLCTYPAAQCGGGTCAGGTVTPPVFCSDGSCPGTAAKLCTNNLACNGMVCRTGTCGSDSDCASGFFCASDGSCQAVLAQGAKCAAADCKGGSCTECAAGPCVDGYCCNTSCTGQCQACNLTTATGVAGSKLGTCSTVAAAGAPVTNAGTTRSACTGTGTSCAGSCGGSDATACVYPTATCVQQTCAGGVVTLASTCSNGSCVAPKPATQTCSGGTCSGSGCGGCTMDSDCGTGKYCSGGACVTTLNTGSSCTRATECSLGYCVDGFCCGTPCNGSCQNCNTNPGSCMLTASGQPVTNAGTTRAACPGTGTCEESCNGSSASCADAANGAQCVNPSCNTSSNIETLAATCAGGACATPATSSCGAYLCSGTACGKQCTVDTDCSSGHYCSSSTCVPTLADGQACTGGDGAQCQHGNCVAATSGYVCCATACTGTCSACDGSNPATPAGTCGVAASGKVCGGSGSCAGHCDGSDTTCTYPSGNTCGTCATCSGGSCRTETSCKGACGSTPCGTGCCAAPRTCGLVDGTATCILPG